MHEGYTGESREIRTKMHEICTYISRRVFRASIGLRYYAGFGIARAGAPLTEQ